MPGAGLVKALRFLRLLVAHLLSKRPPEDPAARCDALPCTPLPQHRDDTIHFATCKNMQLEATALRALTADSKQDRLPTRYPGSPGATAIPCSGPLNF